MTKKPGPIVSRHNTTSVSLLTHDNPSLMIYDTANSPVYRPIFGGDRDITLLEEMFGYKLEYASMPHDSMQNDPNNCSALPSGTADEIKLRMTCFQRDATCEDDMDADG